MVPESALRAHSINLLKKVKLYGWKNMNYDGNAGHASAQRITFDGFSDAAFGTNYNYLIANTVVYLNNIREHALRDDGYYYQMKRYDRTEVRLSKMFFDANTRAAFDDTVNRGNVNRFDTWSFADDVDHDFYSWYYSSGGTEQDTVLEIGYKALGTFTVDFRQRNTARGSNGIEGNVCHYEQFYDYYYMSGGHDYARTIDGRTYNSAANLNIIQNVPYTSFDAYYVKVREAALPYLNSITVKYANGDSFTYNKPASGWPVNGKAEDYGGHYMRLNLLKVENGKHVADTSNNEDYFVKDAFDDYWTAAQQNSTDKVSQIIYNVDINQPQYRNAEHTLADSPDFGTWFDYSNPNQDSFEVTGRFFKVTGGAITSTTNVEMRVGGDHSATTRDGYVAVARFTDGTRDADAATHRSNWGYQDYVLSGSHGHTPYKMRHLQTQAHVNVVESGAYTRKGINSTLTNGRDNDENVRFASDRQFSVSFQRHYGWANYNNFSNKLSFTDEAVLRDVMPVCVPNEELEYYGFLSTGMQLLNRPGAEEDLLPHTQYIRFRLEKYTAIPGAANTSIDYATPSNYTKSSRTVVVDRAALQVDAAQAAGGGVYVYFSRPGEELPDWLVADADGSNIRLNPTLANASTSKLYVLPLEANEFVDSYDIVATRFGGSTDYASELDQRLHGAQANMDRDHADVIVYGRPYAYQGQNGVAKTRDDATNTSQTFTRRVQTGLDVKDNEANSGQQYWHGTDGQGTSGIGDDFVNSDNAYFLGYLIPWGMHFSIQRQNNDSNRGTFPYYQGDNETPNRGVFEARLWNISDRNPGQDDRWRASHISSITTTATTSAAFRMQKVYVPRELVPGDAKADPDWLSVEKFTFVYNGQTFGGTWDQLKALGIVSAEPKASGEYAGCYVVDVEEFLRQSFNAGTVAPVTYRATQATNMIPGFAGDTSTVNLEYVNTRISSLTVTFTSPKAARSNPSTMLDSGQYIAADRTGRSANNYAFAYEGVYADRTLEDFKNAQETTNVNKTTGLWDENSTPSGDKTGMAYSNQTYDESMAISNAKTKDPNHAPFNNTSYTGTLHHDTVAGNVLTHTLARMETSMVPTTIFAYDNSNHDIASPVTYKPSTLPAGTDGVNAVGYDIPDGGLYPGDYVEYTLRVGNATNAALPLEHVDASFQVAAGQRIVGWEVQRAQDASGRWFEENTACAL